MTKPKRQLAVQDDGDRTFEFMAATHLIAAAPGRYLEHTKFEGTLGGTSYGLYERLAPRDAHESILSLLAVGVTNASTASRWRHAFPIICGFPNRISGWV